ncbi:hypothetical protein [Bradyrhizobium vignae]|uniref:hypothetical protein n=1 Tax=Bradyrhizobium vignae TaxID=1549949 RepID=UPI00100BB361|nr:hypothetical protein [Bradyrhizobium vignae]RXG93245.1 hypothetical protein EAV90_26730 [Bradyrhizobium vignae]
MDGLTDKLRDIVLFAAGLIAVGALFMAAFEGLNQRFASATFLGTLGVACVFLVFMPNIEMFKVWGVEAKLREVKDTLTQAQVLTKKLNKLAAINARVSYILMGWGNRMDGPSAKEKQAILDEVDKQLADMEISLEERASITKPFVQLIGIDFYYIYVVVMERYAKVKSADVTRAYEKDKSDANRAIVQKFIDEEGRWMAAKGGGPTGDINSFVFEEAINRATPREWLNDQERVKAMTFAQQLITMFKACEKKGGYTPEGAEFVDNYRRPRGVDEKSRELFGRAYGDTY